MNGDLSLSQSLGGLRIANADPGSDDIHSPAQSPSNVEARPNLFHQQTHSELAQGVTNLGSPGRERPNYRVRTQLHGPEKDKQDIRTIRCLP